MKKCFVCHKELPKKPGNEWKLISIHESLFGVKGAYRAVEEYERKHQHSFCKIETWEVIK